MSAKGESWVKEEAQNNYFALLTWLALATVRLKNAKKIGLFCRIPFFEVEEAEQSAFE